MDATEKLKHRSQAFALSIIQLCRDLPKSDEGRILGRQLLRAGTSIAANYRAARRARSRHEFAAKVGIVVEEEADETVMWLELLRDSKAINTEKLEEPLREANELLAIFAASHRTVRANVRRLST